MRRALLVALALALLFVGGATAVPGNVASMSTGVTAPDHSTDNDSNPVIDCFRPPLEGDNDPDGDGLYEDTTGDGNVTFDDAIQLAFQVEQARNRSCPKYYDFDNDSVYYTKWGNYTLTDFEDAVALAFSDEMGNSTAARAAETAG